MGFTGYGQIAQVAGGAMQAIAARLAQKAMERQFQDQMDLQQGMRGQGYTLWEQGTAGKGAEEYNRQLAEGRGVRNAAYGQIEDVPLGVGSDSGNARDKAYYNITGQRRAALGAYSNAALMQQIHNISLQNQLNKISNFSQGYAQVFPYQMYDAQHSQDQLAMLGQIIGAAGGASSAFGQGGGGNQLPTTLYGVHANQPQSGLGPQYNGIGLPYGWSTIF